MKSFVKIVTTVLVSSIILVCTSCSKTLGYSILLWNIPEYSLADGTEVKVYIKSNISHVYVIGLPYNGQKVEVPIWKLTEPESRSKNKVLAEKYRAYQHQYAKCILDGLPIRQDPVNTSKQVYRLRKDEVIRVLYKGSGEIPTNGIANLDGEWLRVLTSSGVQGWCFSYNLRLFEMYADGTMGIGAEEAEVIEIDEVMNEMLESKWYPDYYASMINSGNIDLASISPEYGFDTGSVSGNVGMYLGNISAQAPYSGVTKVSDGVYKFNDAPFQVTIRSNNSIIVQYTDEKGMPKSYNFVRLGSGTDISKIISDEKDRRADVFNSLYRFGPEFISSNYGTLSFSENSTFSWNKYNLLVPSVISKSAGSSGSVAVKYFLPKNLKGTWDGVVTFIFDNTKEEVNFLYKKESNGLRLAVANVSSSGGDVRSTSTVSLPANSVVIFFQK